MEPTTSIQICGLRVHARHGVLPQEAIVGNLYELNIRLDFEAEHAMRTDRLDLSINYADVVDLVVKEMQFPSKLLEHVAFNLHSAIMFRYPRITGGSITVYKHNPPIAAEIDKVGFTFSW